MCDFTDLPDWIGAAGTLVAAGIAALSLREIEKTRKDDHMPLVVIKDSGLWVLENKNTTLLLKNVGRGPALNLTAEVIDSGETRSGGLSGMNGPLGVGEETKNAELRIPMRNIDKKKVLRITYNDISGQEFETVAPFIPLRHGLTLNLDRQSTGQKIK